MVFDYLQNLRRSNLYFKRVSGSWKPTPSSKGFTKADSQTKLIYLRNFQELLPIIYFFSQVDDEFKTENVRERLSFSTLF